MIRNLPEHNRQALMLSEIEGLRQKEVAAKQGVSLPGAKARIQRGRAMMKKMLLECCQFEFDHQGKAIDYEEKGQGCGDTCNKC
jgi:RNA polymerase sigma-70 factor (ECF subfamily)